MCTGNCNACKEWPIRPKQLMTYRLNCPRCNDDYQNDSVEYPKKCGCCGIATNDFIRGSLLEVYSKHEEYPIVLVENVCCNELEAKREFYEDALERLACKSDRFVSLGHDNEFENYYIDVTDCGNQKIYYMFDLSNHYSGIKNGMCDQNRRSDCAFKAACMQSDLTAAAEIMSYCNENTPLPEGKYQSFSYENNITAFTYTCYRMNLKEVAFPIIIENFCVAVLIIGQIKLDDGETCEESVEEQLDGIVKKLSIEVKSFTTRMEKRKEMRKTDFLYLFLRKLTAQILSRNADESLNELIEKIYDKIIDTFNCEEMILLYTDSESNYSYYPKDKELRRIDLKEELYPAFNRNDNEKIIQIIGPDASENSKVYYRYSSNASVDCFIMTYIKWKDKEDFVIQTFFDILNTLLFSFLMTKIADEKQELYEEKEEDQKLLIETFSHELNQKLEIIENHTSSLDAKKDTWGISLSSRATEDIKNYIKDFKNLESLLRHFTKNILEQKAALPKNADISWFNPYGAFLFNLQEFYDINKGTRKLYMPRPYQMVINGMKYPQMKADQVLIERCANNLLNNAFKYAYKYTNIFLDCHIQENDYIIEVINYCAPLRDDIRTRVFDWGISQSKLRNYRKPKGNGFGLAMVKHICELHNGTIELLPEVKISEYNMAVLQRIMDRFNYEKLCLNLKEEEVLLRLGFSKEEFDELDKEYRRLSDPANKTWKNSIAEMFGLKSPILEVVNPSADYEERLSKRYIHMTLKTPTVLVRFRIKIPQ